jgi:hypothetical protein
VILYLLLPSFPFIFGLSIPSYPAILILSAIIPTLGNLILNVISLNQDKKVFNENIMKLYEEESKLKIIVKPKSSWPEFFGTIFLTVFYGLFAGSAYYYLRNAIWLAILHYIASLTMFLPLLNSSPGRESK